MGGEPAGPKAVYKQLTDAIGRGDEVAVESVLSSALAGDWLDVNLIRVGLQNGARKGHAAVLEIIVRVGKSAALVGEDGNLLRIGLQEAAKQGHEAAALVLLRHGAKTDTFGGKGSSALYWCVSQPQTKGHLQVAKLLLEWKADTEWCDEDGRTVFMSAAWRGHQEALEVLLKHGVNVNARDNRGRTVLHNLAAESKKSPRWNETVVTALLGQPIDLSVKDVGQRTALHWAASTGKIMLLERLLSRPNGRSVINIKSSRGKTALHLACDADPVTPDIIKLLLERGAQAGSTSDGGWTAVHYAASVTGSVEIVQMLLKYAPEALNAQTSTGMTALHVAAQAGNVDVVKCLLLNYRDTKIHSKDAFHCTPLLRAAGSGHSEVVELLAPFNNVDRLSAYALEACQGFEATVVDFRAGGEHQNLVQRPSVFDVLYGKEPNGEHRFTTQVQSLKTRTNKPQFRWIHLPANNIHWVEALICKAFIEEGSSDVAGFKGVEKGFSAQHRGPKYHSHYMRPLCQRSPRGTDTMEKMPVYSPLESALRATATRARARYTSSPERFGKSSDHSSDKAERKTGVVQQSTVDSNDSPGNANKSDEGRPGTSTTPVSAPVGPGKGRRKRHLGVSNTNTDVKVDLSRVSHKKGSPRVGSLTITEGLNESQGASMVVSTTSNIVLFLPYLHIESFERYKRMRAAIKAAEMTTNPALRRKPTCHDEALVWAHLQSSTGLHLRRTLDQFYLHGIDTDDRDADQVVGRYCRDKGIEETMFMVDQCWLWILGPGLVITAFPQRWQQPKNDPLDVLDGIIQDMNSDIRSPVSNVYDLATLITARICGTFDRHQPDNEQYQFLDIFESSIGNVSDQETTLYRNFYKASREVHSWLQKDDNLHEKSSERTMAPVHSRYPALVDEFLDIGKETELLQEIKDIRDELNMISMVLNHQKSTLPSFCDAICEDLSNNRSTTKLRETKRRFDEQRRLLNSQLNEISRMTSLAAVTEESLLNLLDLKQKQANAFEARFARDQAAGTVRQGQIILVFTLVTIIFLPITTIATFFTIPISDFPGANTNDNATGLRIGYVAKYTFGIGLAISVLLISAAFSVNPLGAFVHHVQDSFHVLRHGRAASPSRYEGSARTGSMYDVRRFSQDARSSVASQRQQQRQRRRWRSRSRSRSRSGSAVLRKETSPRYRVGDLENG